MTRKVRKISSENDIIGKENTAGKLNEDGSVSENMLPGETDDEDIAESKDNTVADGKVTEVGEVEEEKQDITEHEQGSKYKENAVESEEETMETNPGVSKEDKLDEEDDAKDMQNGSIISLILSKLSPCCQRCAQLD